MQIVNKLFMISMAVSDMPKAKEFYADKLGLQVRSDYRQDDDNWWVTLNLPEGGVSITLAYTNLVTGQHEHLQPNTLSVYLATSDLAAAHKELSDKGVKVNDIKDDLYGPGSGVKWFNLEDPNGNWVHLVQA